MSTTCCTPNITTLQQDKSSLSPTKLRVHLLYCIMHLHDCFFFLRFINLCVEICFNNSKYLSFTFPIQVPSGSQTHIKEHMGKRFTVKKLGNGKTASS